MTALPDDDPTLTAALTLARLGYRVLPIRPGDKRPPMQAWQDAATTNPDTIGAWWTGLYRDHGVGVATGRWRDQWLFVVDVDEHGQVSGGDTLHDLEHTHGALPTTVEALTGSGGRHIYFTAPTPIRNDAGRRMGAGIDIRGDGGQVLAPPTRHPNGNRYEWLDGCAPWDIDPAPAPAWLLARMAPQVPPQPVERPVSDDFLSAGPIDRFNAQTPWEAILRPDGWVPAFTDAKGETHWTRPGKSEGTSATTGWNGQDFLRVFTTSIPWLPEGPYSKIQYVAARDHGGDIRAALRAMRTENGTVLTGDPEGDPDDTETSWEDRDLSGYLDGTADELLPTILKRTDGQGTLYLARINALFGQSGSGKSWVALLAATQMIAQGRHVAYIDFEDHPRTMVRRLLALGAHPDNVRRYFHYKQPSVGSYRYAVEAMDELVNTVRAELVVVDSYGEALALFGVDQNDDHGVATFTQSVLRPWTRMGMGVLLLDHIPKSEDSPALFAIGSQRKRAAIDGAAFRVNQVKSFGKGVDGRMVLICAKDRGGTYPIGHTVAEIEVQTTEDGSSIRLVVNAPEGRDASGRPMRPTGLMEKVSRFLEGQVGQVTRNDVRRAVPGKTDWKARALDTLVEEGFVTAVETTLSNGKPGTVYISHRPFRDGKDAEIFMDSIAVPPVPPSAPSDLGALLQRPKKSSAPSAPALHHKGGAGGTARGLDGVGTQSSAPYQEGSDNDLF